MLACLVRKRHPFSLIRLNVLYFVCNRNGETCVVMENATFVLGEYYYCKCAYEAQMISVQQPSYKCKDQFCLNTEQQAYKISSALSTALFYNAPPVRCGQTSSFFVCVKEQKKRFYSSMHIAEIACLIAVTSAQTSSIVGRSFGASIEHERPSLIS
jgi:hypothetical protein